MKTIYPILTVVLAGLVIWLLFFRQNILPSSDNLIQANNRLELRHIWDSIDKADYIHEREGYLLTIEVLRDSVEYSDSLVRESKKKIIRKEKEIESSNVKTLSTYFDGFVGKKEGKTVKEIDSSQLVKSDKLFNEAEGSRDVIAELTNEKNYQTMVSTKYEEAYDDCNQEVMALNDSLEVRGEQNKTYVKDNEANHKKEVKKLKRQNTWTKIIAGTVVVGVVILSIFASGT